MFLGRAAEKWGCGGTKKDDGLPAEGLPSGVALRTTTTRCSPGAEVSIDLAAAFVGYATSPSYSSSDVVNGTITLSGKSATFKATACGLASWKLTVKDGVGDGMTKDMVAFVDAAAGAVCP
jgi:hypothetical protein